MKIHNLGEKVIITKHIGCNHEELTTWYNNNEIINNFIGCVEVTREFLETEVPITMPYSQVHDWEMIQETIIKTIINEAGEEEEVEREISKKRLLYTLNEEDIEVPLMRQMKWHEYSGCGSPDYMERSINDKYLLPIGKRDLQTMNRSNPVLSEEFYAWANFFGINNINTKSETELLIKWPEMDEEE